MQDYSDESIDLPNSGGRTSRGSSNSGSNNGSNNSVDLLGGMTPADPYAADKYTTKRRTSKREKKEKKEKRNSRRTSSSTYTSSSGGSNGSNSLNSSSKQNHTDTFYSDDPNSNGNNNNNFHNSATSYANSMYVKQPKLAEPTTNDEINALLHLDAPSGSADPNDPLASPAVMDNFRDEFEDEMDEIEMREEKRRNFDRFGDTEVSTLEKFARQAKLYMIPLLIALLFLLGVAAGILYLVGFGQDDNNNSTSAQKMLQAVPVAPATLKLMCEATTLDGSSPNTFQVPALCQEACAKAECCWNAKDGPYACTTDTQNQCAPYADECTQHKEVIGTTLPPGRSSMDVPTFPSSLQASCQRTAFEASNDCRDGCAKASCCWDRQTSSLCTDDTIHNCGNYKEVCDFLNDEDDASGGSGSNAWPFPSAPQGLSVYCDPSEMEEISLHICEDKCNDAECCWKTGVASCVSTYPQEACHDYTQACGILNQLATAPGGAGVPMAPSNLAETCAKDLISNSEPGSEALLNCQRACLAASCCWQPNVESCSSIDRCAAYEEPCSVLNGLFLNGDDNAVATSSSTIVPTAPSNLAETCAKDRISNSESGSQALIECEQGCLAASCCWQPNVDKPCTDNDKCSAYLEPCSVFSKLFDKPSDYDPTSETLAPVISQVPEAPSDLGLLCNPDVLKTSVDGGKFIIDCEKACLKGACCWKENHPTVCADATECSAYKEPCGEHLVDALLSMESGGTTSSTPAPVPATPSPTTAPPTTLPPQIQSDVPEAAGDIGLICNADVLKLSVSEGEYIIDCEKICLEGACCWKENHSTICPDAPQCAAYEPCKEHLVPALQEIEGVDHGLNLASSPSIPAAPSDMNVRCSLSNLNNNPDGRGFCEESCNKALCCWNMEEADSCTAGSVSASVCTGYVECANLLTTSPINGSGNINSNSNAPPAPPSDLSTICAAGNIIDFNGLERCRLECEKAECCWDFTGTTTSCTASADCQTYQTECEAMRKELNLFGTIQADKDGIATACDFSSSSFNRATCDQLCKTGSCCFDDTLACSSGTDCDVYEPCSILTRRRMLRHGYGWRATS